MPTIELPEGYVPVLNHGYVALLDSLGDDLTIVNSARVSFGKRKADMDQSDEGLIGFLMRNRHGTPFESVVLQFHAKCPIFVMREWIRHRISSTNEFSARYTEMPEEWYIPHPDFVRGQVGKPGSYTFESVEPHKAVQVQRTIDAACSNAFKDYKAMLDQGIAKEVARVVLPVAMYTEFYWTINARSLMNFLALRNDERAQREIRCYAQVIEDLFAVVAPVTHAAFVAGGRVAP